MSQQRAECHQIVRLLHCHCHLLGSIGKSHICELKKCGLCHTEIKSGRSIPPTKRTGRTILQWFRADAARRASGMALAETSTLALRTGRAWVLWSVASPSHWAGAEVRVVAPALPLHARRACLERSSANPTGCAGAEVRIVAATLALRSRGTRLKRPAAHETFRTT